MKRRVFYSFHYRPDCWRASQIRNAGVVEGNQPCSDSDWEEVKKGGDAGIKSWIETQLEGTSCAVVLIGENTAGRKWISYEIKRAWDLGKGVVGIYIHGLQDQDEKQCNKGGNPFDYMTNNGIELSKIVEAHETPYYSSKYVYQHIIDHLSVWIEEAIALRDKYG